MANPLVNELIITTPFKDEWNASEAENEANFRDFYKDPVVAKELKPGPEGLRLRETMRRIAAARSGGGADSPREPEPARSGVER